MLDDVPNERFCAVLGQVLRNLECDREVEPAAEVEWLIEALSDKTFLREAERVARHPRAVDADVIHDPVKGERLEPDTDAAAKVDHALRTHALDHEWHDRLGGCPRPIERPAEELRRVRRLAHPVRRTSARKRCPSDSSTADRRVSKSCSRPSALTTASRSEPAAASAASAAASDVVRGGRYNGSPSFGARNVA